MKTKNNFIWFATFALLTAPSFTFATYFSLPVEGTISDITSHFDHSATPGEMVRYDGVTYSGSDANISTCIIGEGCYDDHDGIDFDGDIGDDIFAVYDGEVKSVYWNNFSGWTMDIYHDEIGLSTLYAHLGTTTIATTTDQVTRVEHIAEMDMTGSAATGPHLHFGVVDDEDISSGNRIDPFGWSGTTTDPWPHNQGYLWSSNPPAFPTVFSEDWEGFTGTITGNDPWIGFPGRDSFSVSSGQGVGGSNALYTGSYTSKKSNLTATTTSPIYIPGTDFDLSYYIRPDNLTGTPNNDAASINMTLGDGLASSDISVTFFRPSGTPGRIAVCGQNRNATSTGLSCFYAPAGTSWAGVPHRVRITREGHDTCFRMWEVSDPMPPCQMTRYEVTPSTLTQLHIQQTSNRWRNTAIDDFVLYTLP